MTLFDSLFDSSRIDDMDLGMLCEYIKRNPKKNDIEEIRSLRTKGDLHYKKIKEQLPILTPFGSFRQRNINGLNRLSGYIYIDIDHDPNDPRTAKQKKDDITRKFSDIISLCCISSSGAGLSIFVKVDRKYDTDEWKAAYDYVRNLFHGYKTDDNITSFAHPWFISYDNDVYYNPKAIVKLPVALERIVTHSQKLSSIVVPRYRMYSMDEIKRNTYLETPHSMVNDVMDITSEQVIQIKWPKKIYDGQKRKVFYHIIRKFMILNPDTYREYVFALIHNLNNKHAVTPATERNLDTFITNAISIENEAEERKYQKNKRVHVRKDSMHQNRKVKEINVVNGLLKKKNTVDVINNKRDELIREGRKVNQSIVATETGISRQTVNKYWDNGSIDDEISERVIKINAMYRGKEVLVINKNNYREKKYPEPYSFSKSIKNRIEHNRRMMELIIPKDRRDAMDRRRKINDKARKTREMNKIIKIQERIKKLPITLAMINEKFNISMDRIQKEQMVELIKNSLV